MRNKVKHLFTTLAVAALGMGLLPQGMREGNQPLVEQPRPALVDGCGPDPHHWSQDADSEGNKYCEDNNGRWVAGECCRCLVEVVYADDPNSLTIARQMRDVLQGSEVGQKVVDAYYGEISPALLPLVQRSAIAKEGVGLAAQSITRGYAFLFPRLQDQEGSLAALPPAAKR
ncbi:hypothetical protein A2966_04610 [Candidatus Roizmanbacteria bacterium RIFCSPLOWO2_01_FULL_41_22]|uniref:Uncharacterized protein n=1 Tax=Candidatus Roizmanbacteria bacterium RIFCSPLOWO2_01_FULL_41_22 TaxID=1802067 RepID=A0A1F7J7E4_9BACT|nr:MAG: hypothetical protein A2966_04610 [Candidatus Roizmanbacteria bacterium RIFCSPLOWO2_01_FULL_41_22]